MVMTNIDRVTISRSVPGRTFGYGIDWVNRASARRQLAYLKESVQVQGAVYKHLEQSRLLKGTAAYTLDGRMVGRLPDPSPTVPAPSAKDSCSRSGSGLAAGAQPFHTCSQPVARRSPPANIAFGLGLLSRGQAGHA